MIKIPEGINTNKYYLFEQRIQFLIASNVKLRFKMTADREYQSKAEMGFGWSPGTEVFLPIAGCLLDIPIDSTDRYYQLTYYDSLQVHQHMYHNVYRGIFALSSSIADTTSYPVGVAYPLKYYYCLPYGMIRFDMSDSSSWELDRLDTAVTSVLK
jgi:hypothetical protein